MDIFPQTVGASPWSRFILGLSIVGTAADIGCSRSTGWKNSSASFAISFFRGKFLAQCYERRHIFGLYAYKTIKNL